MDLTKLSKNELLKMCEEQEIKKCKSKNKKDLINLIKNNIDKKEVKEVNNLTFIDLFCGIGGFHQALKSIGGKCVLACDIDKDCREVYLDNYGIEPVKNIKDIDENNMIDFDILCGGFPCQTFSNGGNKKCFEDERGLLFDEIIRIAKVKKPKFMFLENVKHILKVGNGEVIKYITNKIKIIGYELQIFQISPHNYGIPQQRERVYFVCIRKDIYNGKKIELPKYTGKLEFEKFLDKREEIDNKYFINGDILNVLMVWDKLIKKFELGEKISPVILINDAYKSYTENEYLQFPNWKKDYMKKNKYILQKYKQQIDEWYLENKEILLKREIYGKLEWQTGCLKTNDSIFNHFIQIRQSGIRVKKVNYFPTLVAITQIPIYGKEKRYITPRECARLQSFPETFKLSKSDKISYKQLGNSVNVDNVFTVINTTLNNYISS
jgi:DNA (cytosine-5)-methyltransferase 1